MLQRNKLMKMYDNFYFRIQNDTERYPIVLCRICCILTADPEWPEVLDQSV